MRWFEGSISDAVASSKARNAVFVVFVEGPDDVSQSVSTAINTAEVSSKLESSDFVAIKLDSSTEPYRQFAQIYQVVPVPSLFFIGRDGRPLEIVAGTSTSSEIVRRIETILAKTKGVAAEVGATSVSKPAETAPRQSQNQEPSTSVTAEAMETDAEPKEAVAEPKETVAEPKETEAETRNRIEAAKALVEKNRARKAEEEKEREREREVERRKVGQEVQRLRQWQQDQEYKQLKEDREREKREEAAARERVRNQIAQDKAERAKRNSLEQEQVKKEAEKDTPSVPRPVSNSDTARLQLRLPDGSSVTHQLASSAPLGELRAFVSDRLNQTAANFSMSTTFPRRVLTPAEDCQTMTQLELVPTAVILVLPASGGTVAQAHASASVITPVTKVFWALLTPLLSIFTYMRNLVFGRGVNQSGGVASDASSRRRFSPEPSQGGATRRIPATSEVRRQGNSNVHRLAQARDSSDEDNNTWNGNSTQQM